MKGAREDDRGGAGRRADDMLARLRELLARSPRGVSYTHEEIAAAAGCSHQNIQQIEARALKKLRRSGALRRLL